MKMITTVTTTTATTGVTNFFLYAGIVIVALIAFLGLKEILDTVKMRRHHYKSFLSLSNVVISALFLVFVFLVVYKLTVLF